MGEKLVNDYEGVFTGLSDVLKDGLLEKVGTFVVELRQSNKVPLSLPTVDGETITQAESVLMVKVTATMRELK